MASLNGDFPVLLITIPVVVAITPTHVECAGLQKNAKDSERRSIPVSKITSFDHPSHTVARSVTCALLVRSDDVEQYQKRCPLRLAPTQIIASQPCAKIIVL